MKKFLHLERANGFVAPRRLVFEGGQAKSTEAPAAAPDTIKAAPVTVDTRDLRQNIYAHVLENAPKLEARASTPALKERAANLQKSVEEARRIESADRQDAAKNAAKELAADFNSILNRIQPNTDKQISSAAAAELSTEVNQAFGKNEKADKTPIAPKMTEAQAAASAQAEQITTQQKEATPGTAVAGTLKRGDIPPVDLGTIQTDAQREAALGTGLKLGESKPIEPGSLGKPATEAPALIAKAETAPVAPKMTPAQEAMLAQAEQMNAQLKADKGSSATEGALKPANIPYVNLEGAQARASTGNEIKLGEEKIYQNGELVAAIPAKREAPAVVAQAEKPAPVAQADTVPEAHKPSG